MFFHWSIVDFGCISYKRPWFPCSLLDLGVTHSASVILLIYPNIKAELYIHWCCWVYSGLVLTLSHYQIFCSELMSKYSNYTIHLVVTIQKSYNVWHSIKFEQQFEWSRKKLEIIKDPIFSSWNLWIGQFWLGNRVNFGCQCTAIQIWLQTVTT